MLRRWSKTRSWLVISELLALFWFAVAVNRFQRTDAVVSTDVGVTPMAWELLMDFIIAASLSAVCAAVGLIPAAWKTLAPSGGKIEPSASRSSGATSAPVGRSLSA